MNALAFEASAIEFTHSPAETDRRDVDEESAYLGARRRFRAAAQDADSEGGPYSLQ